MAKQKKTSTPIDLDAVGKTIAELLAIKGRLIGASAQAGDQDFACQTLEDARTYVRMIREGLEIELRDGGLQDLTPEAAQQAIHGCQMLEESLQADPKSRQ